MNISELNATGLLQPILQFHVVVTPKPVPSVVATKRGLLLPTLLRGQVRRYMRYL